MRTKPDFRHALAAALERGLVELSPKPAETIYLNAVPVPDMSDDDKMKLVCEQRFRPEYLQLEKSGYDVKPDLVAHDMQCAIVVAGRNRRLNEYNVIRAWNAVSKGGKILIAGNKTEGIGSLRKWASGWTDVPESFSKYHAIVFTLEKTELDVELPDLASDFPGYSVAQGMFSADGPDEGSEMLVHCFDNRIYGDVADFGAGWGYLSAELIKRSDRLKSLKLYEADWHSLDAARSNLSGSTISTEFHWIDITQEYRKHVLDWVIMNPPFHIGRSAMPDLGKRFIQTAASTLPSGGRLLMVANKNLPYEGTLETCFRAFDVLANESGFKVIEARK